MLLHVENRAAEHPEPFVDRVAEEKSPVAGVDASLGQRQDEAVEMAQAGTVFAHLVHLLGYIRPPDNLLGPLE